MTDTNDRLAAELAHLHRAANAKGDPVPPPLTMAAMYNLPGAPAGYRQYGRFDNPTWEATEALLGHLERATAIALPSGMAAISSAFLALLGTGDRVLLPSDGYYTTRVLSDRFLKKFGIQFDTRPTASFLDGGFDGYRLVFVETPSNPGLDICDIAATARLAHAAGAIVVADNTTMTPFGQRPLDLGVDVVVAADTKAPNGHSDVLLGHVASRDEAIVAAIRDWRKLAGPIPGPFEAWLVHRGLETLEVRFDRMCRSAETIAPRLAAHTAVRSVRFPGLEGDPSHNLARVQMDRFGFLIGLTLESETKAEAFINGCALIQPATSFGGVHSSAERRARWGDAVEPGFVRLSVGCEPTEELWRSLSAALDEAAAVT
ncbi:MAG: cystathionine gamma-lyase [Rhizobiaceae bacterium]